MKSLKGIFAGVIAVVALTFTIATNASAVRVVNDCFKQVTFKTNATQTITLLQGVQGYQPQYSYFGSFVGSGGIQLNPETTCLGTDYFCCARLSTTTPIVVEVFKKVAP
jgi:hypothetical protein